MIRGDGWANHCIWEHSTTVRELYRRRCRKEEPEMTAHAQAAEILAGIAGPGETLLDAGCGSGYFSCDGSCGGTCAGDTCGFCTRDLTCATGNQIQCSCP